MAKKTQTREDILRARGAADAAAMERIYGGKTKQAKKTKKK